jgi:hypothetical protein
LDQPPIQWVFNGIDEASYSTGCVWSKETLPVEGSDTPIIALLPFADFGYDKCLERLRGSEKIDWTHKI